VWCWGSNQLGQLANDANIGTSTPNPTPTKVIAPGSDQTWLSLASGDAGICGIRSDHTLWCWGSNHYGELGNDTNAGTLTPNPEPTQVTAAGNDQTWLSVVGGYTHTCGIRSNHTLWCWGWNSFGQLGNDIGQGTFDPNPEPAQVFATGADQTWLAVDAGDQFTCGIRSDRTLWCWGKNGRGQLGNDSLAGGHPTPSQVIADGGDQTWRAIAAGGEHTCGIRTDDSLWCWGYNYYGQLGNDANTGSSTANPTPTKVIAAGSDQTWRSADAGDGHTCAIRADDTLWCWGVNWEGEIADDSTAGTGSANDSPAQVFLTAAYQTWKATVTGTHHTCGIRTNHTLWCWGDNYAGQLGTDVNAYTQTPNPTPIKVVRGS